MKITIDLDEEIEGFNKMDILERREEVGKHLDKAFNDIRNHIKHISLLNENSRCNRLVLDTEEPYIITSLE